MPEAPLSLLSAPERLGAETIYRDPSPGRRGAHTEIIYPQRGQLRECHDPRDTLRMHFLFCFQFPTAEGENFSRGITRGNGALLPNYLKRHFADAATRLLRCTAVDVFSAAATSLRADVHNLWRKMWACSLAEKAPPLMIILETCETIT